MKEGGAEAYPLETNKYSLKTVPSAKDYLATLMKREVSRKKRVALPLAVVLAAIGIGSALLFNSIIDRDAPQLVSIKYKDKLAKGEFQEISILVNEINPSSSIILYLNNTSIEIQLTKNYMNGTILYEVSFDPSVITDREEKLKGNVTISDKFGNKLTIEVSFYANLKEPEIRNLKVEKVLTGEYKVSAEIVDESPVEAYIELLNGTRVPLRKCNNRYCASIFTLQDLEFSLKVKDRYNLSSTLKGSIKPPLRDKFEAWIPPAFDRELCLNLFDSSLLFQQIFKSSRFEDAENICRVASLNYTIASIVLEQVERDERVKDKAKLTSEAFKLLLNLNYAKGKVKVLIPGTNQYREEPLRLETLQAFLNCTFHNLQMKYPPLSHSVYYNIGNATQINPTIVDFQPIIIRDFKGRKVTIESNDVARDTWMIANLLKERPEIISQPQKYEWINRMIQQIAWNIFEMEFGPGYWDWKNYKSIDPEVWEVILPFHDYMDSLPSKLEKDGIGIIFPYYDSNLLKEYIADKANRTIALFHLANLLAKTIDIEFAKNYIKEYREKTGREGIPSDLKEKSLRKGIKGMKLFVEQLPNKYEEIVNLYPYGRVGIYNSDPRMFYDDWLHDRYHHSLSNTVRQFVGFKDSDTFSNFPEFRKLISMRNGIDQLLSKNYPKWDLIKFIYGYERCYCGRYGGEAELYFYILPLVYKAFGIPYGEIGIEPVPFGTIDEWAVFLPDNIIQLLKQNFGNIAIGYGNLIGLYSCKDGLEKDGIKELYQGWGGVRKILYLWSKSRL